MNISCETPFLPLRYIVHKIILDKWRINSKRLIGTLELIHPGYKCYLTESGRSGLYVLLESLKKTEKQRVVLIPDYICDIVEKTVILSGFIPKKY